MLLKRVLPLLLLTALLIFAMQGCDTGPDVYFAMQIEKVAGRPYLLLQYKSSSQDPERTYFSIYTPKGKNFDEWLPVTTDRFGPVRGLFAAPVAVSPPAPAQAQIQAPASAAPATPEPAAPATPLPTMERENPAAAFSERLGLFHDERVSFLDVGVTPPSAVFVPLPFKWTAETAVRFKGATYAFGVEESPAGENPNSDETKGLLRAARFDGKTWEALKLDGPEVRYKKNPGFLLQAVALKDGVKVFWRQYDSDQVISPMVEGLRVVTQGKAYMASFDGQAFSSDVAAVVGLPRGNITALPDSDRINFLVQTVSRPGDEAYRNSPMELRVVIPQDGAKELTANPVETIGAANGQGNSGLFRFIAAGYTEWEGQEFILRTNWQSFEVWQKSGDKDWTMVARNPKGLPSYNLDTVLLSSLFFGLALIIFGVGLAYRRRKTAWDPARKVHPRDVYASLGIRIGAYLVDVLVICVVLVVSRYQNWNFASVQDVFDPDVTQVPQKLFLIVYMGYLVFSEWLAGATLGKYIMGLRVVGDTGRKLGFWPALVRNLVGFWERSPLLAPFIAMPMIIFTPRRQRLGDLLSRTYVVHKSALDAFLVQRAQELAERQKKQTDDLGWGGPDVKPGEKTVEAVDLSNKRDPE